jgi:glyoxylase-like metal-dependent hydrolase (beta-lactamase superfamily II)
LDLKGWIYVKISEDIYFIPCVYKDHFTGSVAVIDGAITIVDTGMPYSPEQEIFPFLKSIGRDPKEIKHIVLTHCHYDHVAGVGAIRKASREVEVIIHKDDYPYVEDPKLIDRDLSSRFPDLQISELQSRFEPILGCRLVEDGQTLNLSGREFRIMHVPGHSAGAICLVEPKLGVYVTGDSVQGSGHISPYIFHNVNSYIKSMEKLKRERINFLAVAHSFGPFNKGVLAGEECQRHVEESIRTVNELSSKVLKVLHKTKKPMSLTEIHRHLPNTQAVTIGTILENLLSENAVSRSEGKTTLLWSAKL